jgi:hypothetical protein
MNQIKSEIVSLAARTHSSLSFFINHHTFESSHFDEYQENYAVIFRNLHKSVT